MSKKKRFKPRCQMDEDTGQYVCNPELITEEGVHGGSQGDILRAEIKKNGDMVIKETGDLDEDLIDRTVDHLQSRR